MADTPGLAEDLREGDRLALERVTASALPSLAATQRQLRVREEGARRWRARVWRRSALAAAAAGFLMLVPLPFPSLAGHEVTLQIPSRLSGDVPGEVARGLRAGLGAQGVAVDARPTATLIRARVPGVSGAETRARADAFVARLRQRGLEAAVSVSPWTVTGTASVYAFARRSLERVLVEVRARSAAEIEQDVRARLLAAGFEEARLLVHREEGLTRVELEATGPGGRVVETEHETRGSRPGTEPPLTLELPDFSDLDGFPLEARRDAIERRLRERGVEATVTIENGSLRVDARQTETTGKEKP